jgi:hypothetical protein
MLNRPNLPPTRTMHTYLCCLNDRICYDMWQAKYERIDNVAKGYRAEVHHLINVSQWPG